MAEPAEQPTPSLRGRAIKGFGFTASRGVITTVLRVVTVAVLARLVTPTDFGLFATATLLLALPSMLLHRGLADAIVQRSELSARDGGTALTLLFLPSLLCGALFWVLAPAIENWLGVPELSLLIRGMCFAMPIEAIGQLYRGDAARHLEFERAAIIDAAAVIIGNSAIPIGLAFLGYGYWALVAGAVAQTLIQFVGFGAGRWRSYRPALSVASVKRLFAFSALIGLWNIFGYCAMNIERLVLARFMGAEAVGLFSRARGFVGMFVEFYGMPVNQVLFPVLAKLQDERERLLKAYRQAVAFSALLALPSAVGLAALAAPLVGILLGEQWREIVPLVRIMAPTVFFMIMAMPFVAIVRGIGEIKEAVLLTAAETIALIVGAVFLSPYGLAAVAVLTTVVSGAAFVAGNAILARKLKVPAGLLYRPMRAGAIYAAIVAAIWAALEMLTPLSTDTLIGSGAFSSLCAAAMGMIVLTAPRWFLGEDLLWLEELMTKGRYKLQMLAAARR